MYKCAFFYCLVCHQDPVMLLPYLCPVSSGWVIEVGMIVASRSPACWRLRRLSLVRVRWYERLGVGVSWIDPVVFGRWVVLT